MTPSSSAPVPVCSPTTRGEPSSVRAITFSSCAVSRASASTFWSTFTIGSVSSRRATRPNESPRSPSGRPRPGGGLELDLLEAIYLVEADRLAVRRKGRAVAARELFRAASAAIDSFEIRYLVYRDLRQRGYVVEARGGPVDFQVYPRGGAPRKTPSRYWVRALSERAVFDLAELLERAEEAAGVRKTLLLGLVDEESDVTYYSVREAHPRGHRPSERPKGRIVEIGRA